MKLDDFSCSAVWSWQNSAHQQLEKRTFFPRMPTREAEDAISATHFASDTRRRRPYGRGEDQQDVA